MFLAMQRGELDGQIIGYNSVRAGQPQLWGDKKVRPIIQFARTARHPDLPDIPTGRELTSDPKMLALLDFAEMPLWRCPLLHRPASRRSAPGFCAMR